MNEKQTSGCLPFSLAAIAYLIFSFFSRVQLGQLVWSGIALLLIPFVAALTVRRGAAEQRQRTAFWGVLWAAVFFTMVNLIRIRVRIGSGDTGGNLLAGLLSCLLYGLIAGGVAAAVVRLRSVKYQTGKRESK